MRKMDVERAIQVLREAHPVEFNILAAADAELTEWRIAYANEVLRQVVTGVGTRVGPQFAKHAYAAMKRMEGRDNAVFWRNRS